MKEVLENVSSVRPQPSINSGTGFIIRGFPNNETYRNGLLAESNEFDSFNVESIDVLKGPAFVLYGRIEPGGIINITTKRPLDAPYYSLEQQFGSYDFYRTQWDATGPITSDRSLLYRFTGAYQNSDSFRDFNFVDRIAVNPSLTWRPSAATEVDLEVEGLRQEYQVDRALFAIGDRPALIPIGHSFIDPNDPVDYLSKVHLGFNLTHKFNAAWTLRNRFLATWSDWTNTSVKPANPFTVAAFLDPSTGNRLYPRNIFFQESIEEKYATNLDLTGKFQLGQTRHEVLAGFDYLRSLPTYHIQGNFVQPIPGLEIDIFNPQYGIDPAVYAQALAVNFPPGGNFNQFTNDFYGVYFQDHITLWDRLHILGGGRYDWAETGRGRGASFAEAEANLPSDIRKDEAFSPRVGVLYQPWYWLSVYGNWATSFGANNGLSATCETFDPEIGEQFEAGFKTEVFDQRVSTTLAFYHLTRQNILTPNFITPDPFDSIAVGEARSRGIELDMTGQITEEWNLIGSYAYTGARVTLDNGGLQGNLLSNVPEHAGSLFLKYDFKQHAPLNGLSLGFGAFVVGDRAGDPENTFKLPGYTRLDTFAAYR
ncbi:MAG: TonB-dependent siderophore receptor [Gammaproteobacteria bacterium]